MNWTEEVTVEERNAVEELKKRMIEDVTPKLLEDETVFYRFCKARDFNTAAAESMLRKHLIWRNEFQIDTILEDYELPEVFEKYFPSSFVCFDKEGCLVRYFDVGSLDVKGFWNSIKKTEIYKAFFYVSEKDMLLLRENNKKTGKQASKGIFIYNFANLTLARAVDRKYLEIAIYFFKAFQDNYPENIKSVVAINAFSLFPIVFALIKRYLASALIKKVHCYGTEGWKEYFLENIDAEDWPAFLGGNKTDPGGDPLCKSFIVHGQQVPKSYYFCNREKKLSSSSDVVQLIIARSTKEGVNFDVKEAGSYLEWEFETKSRDIGFGLYFKENASEDVKPVELIPVHRIDASNETEKGKFKCPKVGTYTIMFDNSYSWIYEKVVHFIVTVRKPNDERNPQLNI